MQTGLALSLARIVKWLPFLFSSISRDPKCPYSAKNGFVLCYSCPDYDNDDELGPDAAASMVAARSRSEICEQMVENDTAGPTLLHGNWATHGERGNGQWCSR